MRQNPIHFMRCLVLCLAGYAIYIPLAPVTAFGKEPESQAPATPKIDHILLEVSNLTASIAFYRDFVGLRLKSQSDWFVMLESGNVGCFFETAAGIGKSRVRVGNNRGSGCTLISRSAMLPLWSKKPAKLVTGLSRSQENMILAPKLLLPTLMVTLGRLYLRQTSLPVAKRGRCVNYARLDFNKASPLPEDH